MLVEYQIQQGFNYLVLSLKTRFIYS